MNLTAPESEDGDAEVVSWLAAEGDEVAEGQSVVELAYDKVELEVAAPAGGILRDVRVQEGEVVSPGDVLAVIEVSDARG